MKGNPSPVEIAPGVLRSKHVVELFDKQLVTSTTPYYSPTIDVGAFKKMVLMVGVLSTGAPTTVCIEVQFMNRWDGQFYTLKQDPFAALYYEDGDTATIVQEAFQCDCAGRNMRVKLTGAGVSAAAYFAVSASADFVN